MGSRLGRPAIAVAGVLFGALLVNPVAAHVGDEISHLWGDHIKPKADDAYVNNMESPWAVVGPSGNLREGEGVVGTMRESEGNYYVKFARNVNGCAAVASPQDSNTTPQIYHPKDETDKFVGVYLLDRTGSTVDSGFHLIVRC